MQKKNIYCYNALVIDEMPLRIWYGKKQAKQGFVFLFTLIGSIECSFRVFSKYTYTYRADMLSKATLNRQSPRDKYWEFHCFIALIILICMGDDMYARSAR